MFLNAGIMSFYQNNVPTELMGRVTGIFQLLQSLFQIVFVLGVGVTADIIPLRITIMTLAFGMLVIAVVLVAFIFLPGKRKYFREGLKMRKVLFIMILISISIFTVACSDEEDSKSANDVTMETEEFSADDSSNSMTNMDEADRAQQEGEESQEENSTQAENGSQIDRKVIYTANLRIEVQEYQQSVKDIQTEVAERGGYIVASTMREGTDEDSTNGQITARIPQDQFQAFIQIVEDGSSKVVESSVSGQDVTEEYIDLESQQVVEERLLSFMEGAEATEDLLAI